MRRPICPLSLRLLLVAAALPACSKNHPSENVADVAAQDAGGGAGAVGGSPEGRGSGNGGGEGGSRVGAPPDGASTVSDAAEDKPRMAAEDKPGMAAGDRPAMAEDKPRTSDAAEPLERDFVVTVGAVQIVLKSIPPGQFTMGGGSYGTMQVKISRGFWMGSTELSQAQYEAIAGNNPARQKGPQRPVESINWSDAMAIHTMLNVREAARLPAGYKFRLPTEAEWEYAARAGHTGAIAGTGNMDDMGWYDANSGGHTHDVGTKMANEWGLHDMHGNVWEWNFDDVVLHSQGVRYPTSATPLVDPVSFQPGPGHPYRSGGYHLPASACSAARRDGNSPGTRSDHIGMRLALAPIL